MTEHVHRLHVQVLAKDGRLLTSEERIVRVSGDLPATLAFSPEVEIDGETFPVEYAARSGQIAAVRFQAQERIHIEHGEGGLTKYATRREAYAPLPTLVA